MKASQSQSVILPSTGLTQAQVGTVSSASLSDISELVELERNASTGGWSEAQVKSSLEQHICLVLKVDELIIAHCMLSEVRDEVEVLIFTVSKNWQGKGVGSCFLAAILEQYSSSVVYLEVRENNLPAINLYKKMGFIEQGRRKAYYRDTQEGALIFSRQV